jgi:hypothetical protein
LSLAGKLEDVGLAELLQLLASNEKTGRLTLTRRDGHGVVILRRGRIIYAASNSVRETFGSILVCRGLISEETLMEALERQHASREEKRLGTILIEMGQACQEDLEEAMRHQTGVIVAELFQWPTGFFKFEPLELPERGEIEVDAKDFLVAEGLSTSHVLMEAVNRQQDDEEGPLAALAEPVPDEMEGSDAAPAGLGGIVTDLRSPALHGEKTLMMMRHANRLVRRGLLAVVRSNEMGVISHFGFEASGPADESELRSLTLTVTEPSVFSDVIQKKETYKGPLASTPTNDRFVAGIGGRVPSCVVVIPIIVGGIVAMIFFGDNLPDDTPIGSTDELELLMTEAGLAMESDALESRVKEVARIRDLL